MKAKATDVTNRPQRPTFVSRHNALGRIFHHKQVMFGRQRHNSIHFAGHARVMHRHNRAGFVGDRRFNQRFVNVHGIRADINKDNFRASQHESIGRGDKRIAWHNDFIARLDIQQQCRHLKRCGAGRRQQYFLAAKMLFQPLLAATGKTAVATQFAAVHRSLHVIEFSAHHRRCVKWNHRVTCITNTRCFPHSHHCVYNV